VSDPQVDLTVRAVVARQLRLPPDDLTEDLDLTVTEQDERELICAMGEALDVSFPDDLLDGVHTYADLTSVVRVSLGP
jgi:acyl carrier protein